MNGSTDSRLRAGLRMIYANMAMLMPPVRMGLHSLRAVIAESPHWPRRRWVRLFGWPGVAGIALLLGCLAFYFSAIRTTQARLETARQTVIDLQQHGKDASELHRDLAPAEQLAEFYRTFPDEKNLLSWMEKVFTLARDQGISLEQGEYKLNRDRIGKLVRFQMTLPIRGEYPQIRKFLDSLLTEIPIVSLEHLQLERRKVGDPVLEARIRLTLYLEQGS